MKKYEKNFKMLLITPKKTRTLFLIFLLLGFFVLVFFLIPFVFNSHPIKKLPEGFVRYVISEDLNISSGENYIDFSTLFLGFNPKKPREILKKGAPILFANPPPPPTPSPISKAEATPSPPKVSDANIRGDLKIANNTTIEVNPTEILKKPLLLNLRKNKKTAEILIIHTHTTESFTDPDSYTLSDTDRSLDEEKNMIKIGRAMAEVFKKHNIGVIHDTTVCDYPSYNGAYTRSLALVKSHLKENPDIKIILDVHRDGIIKPDGTKVKVTSEIEGKKVAQCMFVVGSNALLPHDKWQENLRLALVIQSRANSEYEGFMRPIILREERFNQQISTGSLILEVGSNGNTLAEAISGAELMAEIIAKTFEN